jgi:hypothetical protein
VSTAKANWFGANRVICGVFVEGERGQANARVSQLKGRKPRLHVRQARAENRSVRIYVIVADADAQARKVSP